MAIEQGSQEFDLEKTDKLPILTADNIDSAIAEGALQIEDAPGMQALARVSSLDTTAERPALVEVPNAPALASSNLSADFIRPSPIDLPSLAESLRSVEERIAHQQAEYETLTRAFDRARAGEEVAKSRTVQLEADLGSVRSLLEAEQTRTRDQEKTLTERAAAFEAARSRADEALRDAERHQGESRLLKESLAARDATIEQVLHSLGERDAQLIALQQDHAKIQQSLEARGKSGVQLQSDLNAARHAVQELSTELSASKESAAALAAKLRGSEGDLTTVRSELSASRAQAATYIELLRTNEYRRGYEENVFLELDAKAGMADASHNALKVECDRLLAEAANRDLKLAAQSANIEKLQANVSSQTATIAKQSHDLKQIEMARSELNQRLMATEADLQAITAELADREAALKESRSSASADSQRMSALLASAEQRFSEQAAQFAHSHAEQTAGLAKLQVDHATAMADVQARHAEKVSLMQSEHSEMLSAMQSEQSARVDELQSSFASAAARMEAENVAQLQRQKALHEVYAKETDEQLQLRHQEMSVLMAHLQEARRPIEPIEAEVKRLTQELTVKTFQFEELEGEVRKLRASLERTRGALEEREFLIRRLERSEMNNANVLGRIQTSMERLGSAPITSAPLSPMPEWCAELVRIDGGRNTSHTLGRRTRIGRGVGCELQVDSSSVSRHHALIVVGPRDTIIEDLNSTNGVILNGRKITRAFLTDGDTVIVGEVQFRYVAKAVHRSAVQQPPLDAGSASMGPVN
jgi:chromosome segregation ATPase